MSDQCQDQLYKISTVPNKQRALVPSVFTKIQFRKREDEQGGAAGRTGTLVHISNSHQGPGQVTSSNERMNTGEAVIREPSTWGQTQDSWLPDLHFSRDSVCIPAQTRKHPLELEGDSFKNERRVCFIQCVMRCSGLL